MGVVFYYQTRVQEKHFSISDLEESKTDSVLQKNQSFLLGETQELD